MSDRMSAAEYRALTATDEPENPYAKHSHNNPKAVTQVAQEITKVAERKHEEDDITMQLTEYLEVLLLQKKITAFSHIPQETFTKSWAIKKKNTAMGVRSGVPDMLIVFPDSVLFLELKRLKGGVLSPAQKSWIESLQAVRDKTGSEIYASVAYGFDEAKEQVDYLLG